MYALPHTFTKVDAPIGTIVSLVISSEIGGAWHIIKNEEGWAFTANVHHSDARVSIDPDTAWKLCSKSFKPEQVSHQVTMEGDVILAAQVLNLVAVMA